MASPPQLSFAAGLLSLPLALHSNGVVGLSLPEDTRFQTCLLSWLAAPGSANRRQLIEHELWSLQLLKKESINRPAIWPQLTLPSHRCTIILHRLRLNGWALRRRSWLSGSRAITIITVHSWLSANFKTWCATMTQHSWGPSIASTIAYR